MVNIHYGQSSLILIEIWKDKHSVLSKVNPLKKIFLPKQMQQLPPVKSTSDASENDEEQQHVSSSTTTPLKTTTPFLSDQDHNHHVVNNDDEDDEITTRTTRTTITSSGHPSVSTHPMNVSPSSFSSQPEQQQFFQIPKLALSNLHPSNPMNDASQVTHTTQPPPQPFNNYMVSCRMGFNRIKLLAMTQIYTT